ncbi:MAG: SMP-30/gluconolactonase/LRE family protein [Microbacteriaceae bacterium]|nr:SMP-30/gluconolactonase/LRE family protein [Microbacteriaceae bacterium]
MHSPFRQIARGIGFTEGPIRLGDGEIAVTSTSRGRVVHLALDGAPETSMLRQVETGGGPNGLAVDAAGRILVMQNATFRTSSELPVRSGIQLIDGDDVADLGIPDSVAPNDGAIGPDGALWYTDPGRDAARGLGPRVRRLDLATRETATVVDDVAFPNGLAFTPGGDRLVVADSHGHRLLSYPVVGAGLGAADVLVEIPGSDPDGIAFDAAGNLYVAAFAGDEVIVVDPAGGIAERIPTGEGSHPTNLCFAGERRTTLVVTLASGGRVVAFDDAPEGLAL